MYSPLSFVSSLFIFTLWHLSSFAELTSDTERAAFYQLYLDTNGPNWWTPYNTTLNDPCSYQRVVCKSDNSTILEIKLSYGNLNGTLPEIIGSFPNLQKLHLQSNKLSGPLPTSLTQLTNLQFLNLANNKFSGPFPDILSLPLTQLYINNNEFTTLPPRLTQHYKLVILQANHNKINTPLPSLSTFLFLEAVFFDNNQFYGTIPEFDFPGPDVPRLNTYSAGLNKLTGTIPESISTASWLNNFFVQNNSLSGTIPSALTTLPNIQLLLLGRNIFTGSLPEFSPSFQSIDVGHNQLTGPIPLSLFQNPTPNAIFNADTNHLSGSIPSNLENFPLYTFDCNAFTPSPLCPNCGFCEQCGDGYCDRLGNESCANCPQDCGAAPCGVCGDGVCEAGIGESCSSCRLDCGTCPVSRPRCPGTPLECNGRGQCMPDLICKCNYGYTGPGCESLTQTVVVGVNPQNPITNISNSHGSTSFQVNVQSVTEYDVNGNVVKSVDLASVPLFLNDTLIVDENNILYHNWTFFGSLPSEVGSDAFIIVNIFLYYNNTNITFANTTVSIDAQTTKYTLTVRNWAFGSIRNTLGIKFSANSESETCIRSQEDLDGNVQWLKVILPNGNALYAKFMQQVELDGKIIYGALRSYRSSVELRVPHFWNELVFDPNFSLLVTDVGITNDGCFVDGKVTFGISNLTIILVVVLGSLGIFVLVLLGIFIHKKLKTRKKIRSAQETQLAASSSSSNVPLTIL